MNALISLDVSVKEGCVLHSRVSVDQDIFFAAPLGEFSRIDIHLNGSESLCAALLHKFVHALQPGIVIGGHLLPIDAHTLEGKIVGA